MRFAPYLFCLGLAVLAPLACSSSPSTTTTVVRPQLVAVDPDDFMGNIPCEGPRDPDTDANIPRNPNAVHSYVATLFDVTPEEADGGARDPGVPLASSLPTTCKQQVTFAYVVANHRYLAEVDAYHEEPEELSAISLGSRLVNVNGARAIPGWAVAVCGGYPPSPAGGTGSGGGGGTGGGTGGGGTGGGGTGGISESATSERPPGVISYADVTQTPHNCRPVLEPLDSN